MRLLHNFIVRDYHKLPTEEDRKKKNWWEKDWKMQRNL